MPDDDPLLGQKSPAKQGAGAVMLLEGHMEPGGQGWAKEELLGQKLPGGHTVGTAMPVLGQYEPAEQGRYMDMPAEGQNAAAGHALGEEAPAGQKSPKGQGVGSVMLIVGQ